MSPGVNKSRSIKDMTIPQLALDCLNSLLAKAILVANCSNVLASYVSQWCTQVFLHGCGDWKTEKVPILFTRD